MSIFESVVELYRFLGNPDFDDINNKFSATVSYEHRIYELLAFLQPYTGWGEIEELVIDGQDINIDDNIPEQGDQVELTILIFPNEEHSFFSNIDDFIQKSPMLNKGVLRNAFYLVEEDFYFNGSVENSLIELHEMEVLKNTCDLISYLSKVAHYSSSSDDDCNHKLVFFARSLSLTIDTNINTSFLSTGIKNLKVLMSFTDDNKAITDENYFERKGIFINTIVDFLEPINRKKQFHFLLSEWNDFLRLYHNNLGVYLSGFSFHKVRMEVAEAETNFADRLSKIMSDMIAKLLGIPISLIATFSMIKLNSLPELLLIFFGVFLTSLIMFLIVRNQNFKFKIICDAKDIIFSPLIKKSVEYQDDLKLLVSNAKDNLDKNQDMLSRYLLFFQILCWIPTALGGGIILMAIIM